MKRKVIPMVLSAAFMLQPVTSVVYSQDNLISTEYNTIESTEEKNSELGQDDSYDINSIENTELNILNSQENEINTGEDITELKEDILADNISEKITIEQINDNKDSLKLRESSLLSSYEYLTYGDYKCSVSNSEITIIDYTGEDTSVIIPSEINGMEVVAIGSAFYNCKSLESIVIPEGVTSIGSLAFAMCSNLESIELPGGVTSIGMSAFDGCSSLTSIELPEGVISIAYSTFYNCKSLESITIPEGVTIIDDYAFKNCESLESITIPERVTSIGKGAFYNCSSLIDINVDENNEVYKSIDGLLYSIDGKVLILCPGGRSNINISEGVTSIESMAFAMCRNLESITIPKGVTSIGNDAFFGCSSLTSIELPKGVTSISNSTFVDCISLESIKLPEGVTSIGHYTFYNCKSLESIKLLEGVTSIGDSAFYNCNNLIIYGYTGSYAEFYAKENSISFKTLGEKPEIIAEDIILKVGDEFDPLSAVKANDKEDGEIIEIEVLENTVKTNEVGEYKVVYKVVDTDGNESIKEIKVTVRSNEKPEINASDIVLKVGDEFDPLSGVSASDKEDGEITKIEVKGDKVDTSKVGEYKVIYEVTDKDGNTVSKEIKVTVETSEGSDWKTHWARNEIKYAMEKGWINTTDEFRPNDSITRAEFIKIVNKSFGYNTAAKTENFTDVKKGDWWYNEVLIALNRGYITSENETFRPSDSITRQEVAAIITTIKKNKDGNLDKIKKLEDFDKISNWAQTSVEGAVEAGYMGKGGTKFRPKDSITRAEAVVTLYRVVK